MSTRRGPIRAAAALLVLPLLATGGCIVAPDYGPYGYGHPAYAGVPVAAGSNTAASVATGAVAGGLLGAAVSNPRSRGAGAVGGAAAGALIGGLIGSAADRENADAAAQGYGYGGYSQGAYGQGGYGYDGYAYAPSPNGYGYDGYAYAPSPYGYGY